MSVFSTLDNSLVELVNYHSLVVVCHYEHEDLSFFWQVECSDEALRFAAIREAVHKKGCPTIDLTCICAAAFPRHFGIAWLEDEWIRSKMVSGFVFFKISNCYDYHTTTDSGHGRVS